VFAAVILILMGISFVFDMMAWLREKRALVYLTLSLVVQLLAGGVGVGFLVVLNSAIDAAEYKDNDNVGQSVDQEAGYVVIAALPLIGIFITNTVTVWNGKESH
jgi:hypothetical protein